VRVAVAGALVLAGCLSWPEHLLVEGDGGGSSQELGLCPAACTNLCAGGTCRLQCGSSPAPCVCPPNIACEVDCSGAGSCGGGVDCTGATRCTISCGRDACQGRISCGAGPCTVDCSGERSCGGVVDCSRACSCSVRRSPMSPLEVTCPPFCTRGCSPQDDCDQC
jgi:hypothetical protein